MYLWDEFTLGQKLAWIFSTVSNVLWLFVFVPQLYKNYKSQKSFALSLTLLFCLILGDILSIISAYIKELNIVIIYAAAYHIVLDLIIISQILYYRRKNIINSEEHDPLLNTDDDDISLDLEYDYMFLSFWEFFFVVTSSLVVFLISLFIIFNNNRLIQSILADIIAWSATCIFMLARIPQIWLNFKRKSTKGLSLLSFIVINIANMFFLISILIIMCDLSSDRYIEYIKDNIQWITGSCTTSLFDGIIFYQFYKYKTNNIYEDEFE
jgi:uncharacterized protein with PQ loop repeat